MPAQGKGLRYALFPTPLGVMGVVTSPRGIRKVILPQHDAKEVLRQIDATAKTADLGDLPLKLQNYLTGKVNFSMALDLSGSTAFQRRVWQAVRSIPYGETRSYHWVAEQLGQPTAARAVGQALAANPLPLLIPCHRVVGAKGLVGFSGGLSLKRRLLELEASQLSQAQKP